MKMAADAHANISLLEVRILKRTDYYQARTYRRPAQFSFPASKCLHAVTSIYPNIVIFAAHRPKLKKGKAKQVSTSKGFNIERKEPTWRCVEGCGACCKLEKGPSFATSEEIFTNPSDVELYRSLVGPDGWCIHYEKSTRKCSIYPDRPYFCRVEADVFESLYGISKKKFNKEACSSCRDTIKSVYGSNSKELENYNNSLKTSPSV